MANVSYEQDAIDAISESQARGGIVTVSLRAASPAHAGLCEELLLRSDDHADNGDVTEYWGEDDDGEWRVHVEAVEVVES